MKNVTVVIGPGLIGQAIARRVGVGNGVFSHPAGHVHQLRLAHARDRETVGHRDRGARGGEGTRAGVGDALPPGGTSTA